MGNAAVEYQPFAGETDVGGIFSGSCSGDKVVSCTYSQIAIASKYGLTEYLSKRLQDPRSLQLSTL